MTGVDKIAEIRKSRFLKGLPIREITRAIKLSRPTVQKILRTGLTKFSYKPRENQPHPVTERVKVLIDCWVREDQGLKRKQRRSAQRIYDILSAEHGYEGSYESIAKCVRDAKQELMLTNKEAYIPLIYYAGDAFQFDWGEMPVYIGGKKEKVKFDSRKFNFPGEKLRQGNKEYHQRHKEIGD